MNNQSTILLHKHLQSLVPKYRKFELPKFNRVYLSASKRGTIPVQNQDSCDFKVDFMSYKRQIKKYENIST